MGVAAQDKDIVFPQQIKQTLALRLVPFAGVKLPSGTRGIRHDRGIENDEAVPGRAPRQLRLQPRKALLVIGVEEARERVAIFE